MPTSDPTVTLDPLTRPPIEVPLATPDRIVTPADLQWTPFRLPGFCGEMQAALVNTDVRTAPFIALLRMSPGDLLQRHFHTRQIEAVHVLEGEMINAGVPLPQGSFLLHPPGVVHGPHTTTTGCTLMFIQYGGVGPADSVFVDDEGRALREPPACPDRAAGGHVMVPAYAFEPETAAFVRRQDAERAAGPQQPTIDELRVGYRDGLLRTSVPPSSGVAVRELTVDGAAGPIGGRLYTPRAVEGRTSGLLLYVHGGGFAVGDLDSHDALIRLIAEQADVRALAIDYRRAPEHKFPAARDDAAAAFRWARTHATELGVDPDRIVLGGESAGGTHAAAAALALRDAGGPQPTAVWMLVPALDASGAGESHRLFATGAGRPAAEFTFLWSLYRPDGVDARDPGLSPLHADLHGLPPLRLYVAEYDPARSDGEDFAARARSAGVDVEVVREPGLIHQFPEITGVSPGSRAAVVRAARELASLC